MGRTRKRNQSLDLCGVARKTSPKTKMAPLVPLTVVNTWVAHPRTLVLVPNGRAKVPPQQRLLRNSSKTLSAQYPRANSAILKLQSAFKSPNTPTHFVNETNSNSSCTSSSTSLVRRRLLLKPPFLVPLPSRPRILALGLLPNGLVLARSFSPALQQMMVKATSTLFVFSPVNTFKQMLHSRLSSSIRTPPHLILSDKPSKDSACQLLRKKAITI